MSSPKQPSCGNQDDVDLRTQQAAPFVLGITGHMDLDDDDLKPMIRRLFRFLRRGAAHQDLDQPLDASCWAGHSNCAPSDSDGTDADGSDSRDSKTTSKTTSKPTAKARKENADRAVELFELAPLEIPGYGNPDGGKESFFRKWRDGGERC